MDEREKVIREDYPVEKLPEDLRKGFGDLGRVRVTVEALGTGERKRQAWAEIKQLIDKARSSPGFKPVTADQAVARVRALRDEWDR